MVAASTSICSLFKTLGILAKGRKERLCHNYGHNVGQPAEKEGLSNAHAYRLRSVVIVLAVLNGIAWQAGMPRLRSLNVFSARFALGVLGTYIPAFINGYRRALPPAG